MESQPNRRNDRVSYEIPIQVSGKGTVDEVFNEAGRTIVLSRHGASILLSRKLTPQQLITIRTYETQRQAEARVVGEIGGRPEGYTYGIAFLDVTANLWDIDFPPLSESENALGQILMQCGRCGSRELVYLEEFEIEVFEAGRSIARTCKHCRDTTDWKEAVPEAPREAKPVQAEPAVAPAPSSKDMRKQVRVKKRVTALIRLPGQGDETIATVSVSRGGLGFQSRKSYPVGTRINVAIPYTRGPGNIFLPARIVRARELPGQSLLTDYGVEYLRPSSAEQAPQYR